MPTWQVANYRLYHPSGHPDTYILAAVLLIDSAQTVAIQVNFSTAQPLPPNTTNRAYLPFAVYGSFVDMLREEGPIFVINPNNTTVFFFGTSDEPIGEDEGP